MSEQRTVRVGEIAIANHLPLAVIAGPCAIESREHALSMAGELKALSTRLGIPLIYKSSFDKANRTSASSARGLGLEKGIEILAAVKEATGLPVLTDVHESWQCQPVAEVVDVLQIPAFLCRQTDLIEAAVNTGKIVNIKKGQFLSPGEIGRVVDKARSGGGKKLLLTERGTTFGYNNLVADMRSIPIMKQTGCPVIFDATHSVQLPGGGGDKSSGQREFAPVLARCALAAGANGVFIETHPTPDKALSDGPNMIALADMPAVLKSLLKVFAAVK